MSICTGGLVHILAPSHARGIIYHKQTVQILLLLANNVKWPWLLRSAPSHVWIPIPASKVPVLMHAVLAPLLVSSMLV